jgi:hypothetical protein
MQNMIFASPLETQLGAVVPGALKTEVNIPISKYTPET